MDLVTRHWSGKHHRVVRGINLIRLVWAEGDARFPCDFRQYAKAHDELDKNDHFQHMLFLANARGFTPELVCRPAQSEVHPRLCLAVAHPTESQPLGGSPTSGL